ncbi:hypothetical protein [Halorubrum sp. BOL3-1]|nr:hypothetical protein [Halorubrum sp. BOL3-1]
MRDPSALVPVALPAGADPETAATPDERSETDEEGRDGDKGTGPAGNDT